MLCEYVAARKTWVIRFVNQPWIRLTGENLPPHQYPYSVRCCCSGLQCQLGLQAANTPPHMK